MRRKRRKSLWERYWKTRGRCGTKTETKRLGIRVRRADSSAYDHGICRGSERKKASHGDWSRVESDPEDGSAGPDTYATTCRGRGETGEFPRFVRVCYVRLHDV